MLRMFSTVLDFLVEIVCVVDRVRIIVPIPFPVGGMGFGLMSSALAGINMIQLSGGPATAGLFPDKLPEAFFIETGTTPHHSRVSSGILTIR